MKVRKKQLRASTVEEFAYHQGIKGRTLSLTRVGLLKWKAEWKVEWKVEWKRSG